jgi:hypothetical protein
MENATGYRLYSTNTITHEILHDLLGDPLRSNPGGAGEQMRELGIGGRATLLHLGVGVSDVRQGAKTFTLPPNPKLNEPRK